MKSILLVLITLTMGFSQHEPTLNYQFNRPNFKRNLELTTFSGIHQLGINFSVTDNYQMNIDLPVIAFFFDFLEDEKVRIGNIAISLETNSLEYGLILPTTALDYGYEAMFSLLTKPYDLNKFSPKTLSFFAM